MQLAKSSWGPEEHQAILETLDLGSLTMGAKVAQFEQVFADYIGVRHAVMVNSGSSANLLMVAAWTLRYGKGTVIVPALGWSTSYSPFQQYGWKLRFVDIDRETLNYDLKGLWQANEKDDADLLLAINILGNPNDFGGFPRRLRILEDNCESLGAEYGTRRTGTFGVMASHSLFYSHHICTIEGGVITTGVGDYTWNGANGTLFWVDPKEQLVVVTMTVGPGEIRKYYREQMAALVYGATQK